MNAVGRGSSHKGANDNRDAPSSSRSKLGIVSEMDGVKHDADDDDHNADRYCIRPSPRGTIAKQSWRSEFSLDDCGSVTVYGLGIALVCICQGL